MRSQTKAWKLAASKVEPHRGHIPKRQPPFQGKIRIGPDSGLRKRARAIRRGHMDPWCPANPVAIARMQDRHPWWRRKKAWDALRISMSPQQQDIEP